MALEPNNIYLGDCLDLMKDIPDKSIDLVLTDPPYGIKRNKLSMGNGGGIARHINYGNYDWDNSIPDRVYFNEMLRVSKNQIIFGGNYFIEYLKNSPCWIFWDKDNGQTDFADGELAWTSFNSAIRKFKYRWAGMLQENMSNKEKRFHPTQKPSALFMQILDKYSKPNDLVLDCFLGSGTTAIACIKTGRRFIGIEKEPKYFEIAQKRIEQELSQLKLEL